MRRQKQSLILLLCAAALLFAACTDQREETTAPPVAQTEEVTAASLEDPESTPAAIKEQPVLPDPLAAKEAPAVYTDRHYIITLPTKPEQTVVMDAQGKILQDVRIPTPLYDALTGKLRFYTYTQPAAEAGSARDVNWLYNAKGKPLEGAEGCLYTAGMGGFVIKQLLPEDGAEAAAGWLYDPKTQDVVENVWSVERLTAKTALLLDAERHMLGVCDAKGTLLYEDPYHGAFAFGYSCGGYILGYPEEGGCAVLNEKLEVLDTTPKMFDLDLFDAGDYGVYCVKKDDTQRFIYRATDWKLEGTFAEDFQYTDGVNVITGDDHSKNLKLHSMRGKRLAGPFDKISPEKDAADRPTGRYLARSGNTLTLLNKHGETVKQRKISGLTRAYSTFDGLCMCEYSFENDWTGEKETGFRLYTADLQYLTDTERNYLSVEKAAEGLYKVTRQNGEDSFRTDIVNVSGETVFKRPEAVGDGDEAALAVFKDGTVGLIGASGEWIAENSLDVSAEDE